MYLKPPPKLDRLKELYDYNPLTGHFIMKEVPDKKAYRNKGPRWVPGRIAGIHDTKNGYISISIDGCRLQAHRLAWYLIHNEWPDEVDHWDGNPSNNVISNLRNGTRGKNNMNSAGWAQEKRDHKLPRGVYHHFAKSKPYRSQIVVNRKQMHLGSFATIEEAQKAYQNAAEFNFGEFAYHKRIK